MGVNTAALKSPNGLLKIVALVLTIIVLALARAGNIVNTPVLLPADAAWLLHGTTIGAAITLCVLIITYLLGDGIPLKTEALFVLTYATMFIAVGACTIQYYENRNRNLRNQNHRDKALAMGSMAIITGIVMLVDLVLLVKAILKK